MIAAKLMGMGAGSLRLADRAVRRLCLWVLPGLAGAPPEPLG